MAILRARLGIRCERGAARLSRSCTRIRASQYLQESFIALHATVFTMPDPAAALRDARQYRIMHLHAGSGDDTIQFSLRTTACETEPQVHYEALSYAWGDTAKTYEITCRNNSSSLRVTLNCYNALRSLRLPGKTRTLWIDAICIDQEDLDERRAQVAIMQSIYHSACQVVVYLGEDGNGSDAVIQYLQDDFEPLQYSRRGVDVQHPSDEALAEFCARPWFSRVWVLQEVFRKQSIELRCGTRSIRWKALTHYCKWQRYWDQQK